ncbi:MAG: hypothetical protein FJ295_06435 [Planctomycetes bacterium]|nr:hypothetical protein [Planctomycetota bacterium]
MASQSGLQSPEDLVVDADGNVYFTDDDAGGVWRFTIDGAVSGLATRNDGLRSTEGIALAENGHLLIGDGMAHAIFDVAPDGRLAIFLGPEAGYTGVAMAVDANCDCRSGSPSN